MRWWRTTKRRCSWYVVLHAGHVVAGCCCARDDCACVGARSCAEAVSCAPLVLTKWTRGVCCAAVFRSWADAAVGKGGLHRANWTTPPSRERSRMTLTLGCKPWLQRCTSAVCWWHEYDARNLPCYKTRPRPTQYMHTRTHSANGTYECTKSQYPKRATGPSPQDAGYGDVNHSVTPGIIFTSGSMRNTMILTAENTVMRVTTARNLRKAGTPKQLHVCQVREAAA